MNNAVPSKIKRKSLTHSRQADTAKPEEKPYSLQVGDGLALKISPNGSKLWRYRYTLRGRRSLLSVGAYPAIGLTEAKTARDELNKLVAQGISPSEERQAQKTSHVAPALTFTKVIEQYLLNEAVTHKGSRWESIRLQKIMRDFPMLCSKAVVDIDQTDMIDFRDQRLNAVSGTSVSREMQLLGSVFRYAIRELRVIKDSPLKDVNKPKVSAHRERRISQAEIDAICHACRYQRGTTPQTKTQQTAWAFLFAIETAMRASEMTEMTWDRVNEDYIHLPDTKNGTARNVPLLNSATALLALAKGLDAVRVVTVDADSMAVLFRKAKLKAGIDDLHFHDSRHEATTRMAQYLPVQDLSKVTGHKDLKMLMRYYNPTASEIAQRLRKGHQESLAAAL